LHPNAESAFKDSYVVEFIELAHGHSEAELQTALVGQGGFKKS